MKQKEDADVSFRFSAAIIITKLFFFFPELVTRSFLAPWLRANRFHLLAFVCCQGSLLHFIQTIIVPHEMK